MKADMPSPSTEISQRKRACACVHAIGSRSGLGRNRPVVRLLLLGLQGPGGWGESIRPRFMPLSVCVHVRARTITHILGSQLVHVTTAAVQV